MLYPPRASVLGFVALGTARDVVRGFCATFATKSGKENGRLSRPKDTRPRPTGTPSNLEGEYL